MLNEQTPHQNIQEALHEVAFRDIHPLTPPPSSSSSSSRNRRREQQPWDVASHRFVGKIFRSSTLSVGSTDTIGENFTTMSREFNAMVVAGTNIQSNDEQNLERIGEEELEETNPLAIVPDHNPIVSPRRTPLPEHLGRGGSGVEEVPVHVVKKEEVETKICAWQTAEIAKVNNRFKREEVTINGWESEQLEKASAWLKKVERKLDEQRAKAMEKMQNDVAKARRKAEEKRASAEAKRGVKVAKVLELCNLMRAVGRAPSKRSFF